MKKRFSGFKESIFGGVERPAIVRNINSEKTRGLKKAVSFVRNAIKKLLIGYEGINESNYSGKKKTFEPLLFPDTCAYVCNFLMRHGVVIKQKGVPSRKCGTEGCAYFYDDKVLKCTLGQDEWKIATMLKGNRDIVPVIDTDREPDTGVYLILSWKLDTDKAEDMAMVVDDAAEIVSNWFSDSRIQAIQPSDQDAISKLLDFNEFKRAMTQNYQYKKVGIPEIADKLFQLIVEIYRKSDYVIAADMFHKNVGFTDKDEIQPLDFGYPRKMGQGWVGPNPTTS